MLFNSFAFIFAFLPISVAGYYLCARLSSRAAVAWLVLMSIVFYGWWNAAFVVLLLASIAGNYVAGLLLQRFEEKPKLQTAILVIAICANISLLFYYKYVHFIVTLLAKFGIHQGFDAGGILLPLGISFFTFTQIGYLIDCKTGIAKGRRFLDYALFVTFFPHLISGPILHHREMMPQFESAETYKFRIENLVLGLAIFIAGLAKKVLIADQLAPTSNFGFLHSQELGFVPAWITALAYTMQLYFDFSGYSEMAIGQARMFGIKFPTNFNSPYKARNIIDFWQRWHMTLTRYLTLYLYNPVALWVTRRRAAVGKPIALQGASTIGGFLSLVAFPTMFTMSIAGIWHGAGVNFLIFGMLHGFYLTVNHAWNIFGRKKKKKDEREHPLRAFSGWLLTFLCVVVALVFFRAYSRADAVGLLKGMIGLRGSWFGTMPPEDTWTHSLVETLVLRPGVGAMLIGCMIIALFAPNVLEIFARYDPIIGKVKTKLTPALQWKPNVVWGAAGGFVAGLCVLYMTGATEFLYFQF